MIEYVNARLNSWAAMCKRKDDGGTGFPRSTSYCNQVQIHGSGGDSEMIDAAAIEIDGIICKMKRENPDKFAVAEWFYLKGNHTVERIAHELRCCKKSAYNRLHALHVDVQEALFDIEIAAQDRKAAAKPKYGNKITTHHIKGGIIQLLEYA